MLHTPPLTTVTIMYYTNSVCSLDYHIIIIIIIHILHNKYNSMTQVICALSKMRLSVLELCLITKTNLF